MSQHCACPFGATASVRSWERVGRVLVTLARRLLFIPVHGYVDDLFGAERYVHIAFHVQFQVNTVCSDRRKDCAEHALQCLARLIKAVLGDDAVAAHKQDVGPSLVILGCNVQPWAGGFKYEC